MSKNSLISSRKFLPCSKLPEYWRSSSSRWCHLGKLELQLKKSIALLDGNKYYWNLPGPRTKKNYNEYGEYVYDCWMTVLGLLYFSPLAHVCLPTLTLSILHHFRAWIMYQVKYRRDYKLVNIKSIFREIDNEDSWTTSVTTDFTWSSTYNISKIKQILNL